jgi:predicted HAD superfamily Cof-like phosphohydrolase
MVADWHRAFGLPVLDKPTFPSETRVGLRINLIAEEVSELFAALNDRDIVEVADALADLLYVTYGMAHEFGIPIDEVFEEVQESNMSKLGEDGKPLYREDGKVMKGPNFRPPDIQSILGIRSGFKSVPSENGEFS